MEANRHLTKAEDGYQASKEDVEAFSSLVGALQWLSNMTRPDITYVVGKLSKYTANPTLYHIDTAKWVVQYLAGTPDWGLRYGPKEGQQGKLIGYTDASHHDDIDTSRSTGAYIFQLWNGPISWRSKLDTGVSASSAESEYHAAFEAAKECRFLGPLLIELGYERLDASPIRLLIDNQAAMRIANKPSDHSRTKHIRSYFHFVREQVSDTKELVLQWVPSKLQVAVLTKPLGPTNFLAARNMLGLAPKIPGK